MKKIRIYKNLRTFLVLCVIICFLSGCGTVQSADFNSIQEPVTLDSETAEPDVVEETNISNMPKKKNDKETEERAKKSTKKVQDKAEKEYNDKMEEVLEINRNQEDGKSPSEWLFYCYYSAHDQIVVWAAPICVVSIGAGFLLFICATGNKTLRRFALFGLIIGVPVLIIFLVFGVGIWNGVFY